MRLKVVSLTFLSRQINATARGIAGLAVAIVLVLAGCESSTVQKAGPGAQGAPGDTSIFPPGVLSGGGPWGPGFIGPLRPATPATPYVGLLLPLTGPHARVGRAMLNAAQLAIFEIAGDQFVLIVRDTGGSPEGARRAARSALQAGASLILGPLFATSVQAVAKEARPRGVNVLAFSNDASVAGYGVYVMGLSPRSQIERVLDYASLQGLRRYSVLAPETPYGWTVINAMQAVIEKNGVEMTGIAVYDPDEDPSPQVRALANYDERHDDLLELKKQLERRNDEDSARQLKELEHVDTVGSPDFDAVMLPVGGKNLMTIAPLLAYYDVDPDEVQFLGTAFWADSRLGSEVTLQGGWFAAPPPEMWDEFKVRYQATYKSEPARVASLAYDATALAAVLTRRATESGRVPDFSALALTQASGFAGMDGIFRFLPSGEIQRGLAVLEMTDNGLVVLEPAPQSFEELIN
jgi:ABC-type branched-subunit amino acid transport system substrate-binding protein